MSKKNFTADSITYLNCFQRWLIVILDSSTSAVPHGAYENNHSLRICRQIFLY